MKDILPSSVRGLLLPMICFGLVLLSGCELAIKPLPDSVQEEVSRAPEYGLEGILVYVERAGEEPEFYQTGWNDRENQVPVDSHDLFKIASISKLYIAVATAKLAQAGEVSLDRSLEDYLPELADRIENADQITVRMLVQHRSGIPNFTDHPDFPWSPPPSNEEALALVLDSPAKFKPGRRYKYSNTNYLLLVEVLDRALGHSHHRYIDEEILVPLGLQRTYHLLSEVDQDEVMSGYSVNWEGDWKPSDYVNPGGSMVASIQDVGIFLRALVEGTLLTAEEQALYTSLYRYEHTGLLPGYQSIARYHEDLDAVVVQFVNTSGANMWWTHQKIYKRIVRILERE